MEMWLKRSTLVFLTVAVTTMVTSGRDPVILDNSQGRVEVPFGSNLTFHCNLITKAHERFRVFWYVNHSGSSVDGAHELPLPVFNKSSRISTNGAQPDDTLLKYTLSNATDKNNGWYFCKVVVEIPVYSILTSNGTQVIITKSMEHTTHPLLIVTTKQATAFPTDNYEPINWLLWIPLTVCTVVLIVLMLMFILLKKRCSRNGVEDPVYANTQRKQPSPHLGVSMEHLKTVPSSQNLRSPSPGRTYEPGKRRQRS